MRTNPLPRLGEGHEYLFDLSKSLPLIEVQGHQVVPADYFFNNDLAYLKVKVAYDNYAMWGISHWGPKQQSFYGYASNRKSTYDVFSKRRIIAVIHVKVMKWYDYRVEDLKLGAESYQKKLNLTKPETSRSNISKMTPYIAYKNPQGIIYLDKFCDETLTSVRNVLHDIANNPRMEYLPKRSWSNLDRKSSRIMIKVIDQQLFEKRLIRNLGKFIGGREYGEGFRLLERTI
nr:hypothetical protein [Tanacetum cinerariifolium]